MAIIVAPFGVVTADAAAMVFSARMCRPEDRGQRVENSAAAFVPSSLGKCLQTAANSRLTAHRREQCPMACRRQHATPATPATPAFPAIATAAATFGGRGSKSGEEGHYGLVRGWPCADERGDIGSSPPLDASVATRAQVRRLAQMQHERDAHAVLHAQRLEEPARDVLAVGVAVAEPVRVRHEQQLAHCRRGDGQLGADVDGDRPVYLASGVKLFLLIELYRLKHLSQQFRHQLRRKSV
jgi:hypothetical protein